MDDSREHSQEMLDGANDNLEDSESMSRLKKMDPESLTSIRDLPDEILENIFARVPPYDDLDSVKLVCKRWNRITRSNDYAFSLGF